MTAVRVLFLCTGNSARSLMSEALLRHLGGARFEAFSAGTHPKDVNPFTERVLARAGLSVEGLRSKPVSEFDEAQFDYLITVCDDAAEECPVFPGAARRLHWSTPDPAVVQGSNAEVEAAFEEALRLLRGRIEAFVREVSTEARPAKAGQGGPR